MKLRNVYGKNGRNYVNKLLADNLVGCSYDAVGRTFAVHAKGDDGRTYKIELTGEEVFKLIGAIPAMLVEEQMGKEGVKVYASLRAMLTTRKKADAVK